MGSHTRKVFGGAAFLALSAFVQESGLAQPADPACRPTVVGNLDILPVTSKIFGNVRDLRVWLPPNYGPESRNGKKYPVLYMLDGQNLFDRCTIATGAVDEWRVDEVMTRLVQQHLIEPVIVVGIDSAREETERMHEYLPYKDISVFPNMAEPVGKQFPDFLATEVLPTVRAHYRIEEGPSHTGIGGASYGAIAALYALLTRPDLFGQGILESPALQVGNGQLLRDTSQLAAAPDKIFLSMGTNEVQRRTTLNSGLIKMLQVLARNLESAYLVQATVRAVVQPGGAHDERSWSTEFAAAAQFLYSKSPN